MKKAIIVIAAVVFGILGSSAQVFAAANHGLSYFGAAEVKESGTDTAILKNCGAEEGEEAVLCIINLVLDIMTIGIGIVGVVSISIVGIQYLTAGGSEEKTRTAKRRLLEIVIGIAAYVVIYALIKFISPSFDEATRKTTNTAATSQIQNQKPKNTNKLSIVK